MKYNFNNKDEFARLEDMAIDGQLDYSAFPPAEYRYFSQLARLGYLNRHKGWPAQLAQSNLWDMCAGLKEMRDGKLYKELGYSNFEEYCGAEFNMTARNARNYITIVENISDENRKTFSAFSSSKLYHL